MKSFWRDIEKEIPPFYHPILLTDKRRQWVGFVHPNEYTKNLEWYCITPHKYALRVEQTATYWSQLPELEDK